MSFLDDLDGPDRALLEVARRAASRAAEVHRSRAPEVREWVEKGRADFVTDVDLEAQSVILETIGNEFPGHRIVAEEEGSGSTGGEPGDRDLRWIVDPLDGTTNWLHGYPEYAVSIAVEDDRGLRAALVLNSATGERFEAIRGEGARRDDEPIRVSRVADLEMALVGTGFPFKKPDLMDDYLEVFRDLLYRTAGVRRAGSAALDLCDLACGRLDAFWEHWLMPWDVAGGALMVSEAGGHLEEFPLSGNPASPGSSPSFATRRGGAYLGSNAALRDGFRRAVLRQGVQA